MNDPTATNPDCPFCSLSAERLFFAGPVVLGLWDRYSVSPGHALLVPRRHVATWFEATALERMALVEAIDAAKAEIEKHHAPDGYNIGINTGAAAGQTVFHLHVHVIPRYQGDVDNPRGGVRNVIPTRGDPILLREAAAPYLTGHNPLLMTGRHEPLLPHLKQQLAYAVSVDIAVAFVMPSGIGLLWEHLKDLLDRGGRLRILTGDYLDATDPDALLRLLDLESSEPRNIERRVYQTRSTLGQTSTLPTSFHPKAYIFARPDAQDVAFVGSSNLSRAALSDGIEWNYRVVSSRDTRGFAEVRVAFEALFRDPATVALTPEWVEAYRARRATTPLLPIPEMLPTEHPAVVDVPQPHSIQEEALAALAAARSNGAQAGLVVLATGLGKTWLSAFDSCAFTRVLFVAHREEILGQALNTYRRIRPHDYLGHYIGTEKHPKAQVVFASVQTLSRKEHLEKFPIDSFDYIVVDEFHHASAATYRKILRHFRPRFLLGLTATPERSDGADLLELCGGNLIYRRDLADGIRGNLLCPFSYFGVPDMVDYKNVPWRSTKFDEEALTNAVATSARAENAFEQLESRGGSRTLAFCVSQRHADFMAEFLRSKGKRAVAVHSGVSSAPRAESLEQLQEGSLDVVCAVDMFNEGVDLPELDTILMLRPTESRILWLQQFGRGLRRSRADKKLKVIDYIGNHRTFLVKPQTLFGLGPGDGQIQNLLTRLAAGTQELPPGCEVTYDLAAVDILRSLLRISRSDSDALGTYVRDFIERHGVRPTAAEAYRDGYAPRSVRAGFGSWFGFLNSKGALTEQEANTWTAAPEFLNTLESTPMTKSFKMVVLLAALNHDIFPGQIPIDELTIAVREIADRQPRVATDLGEALGTDAMLRRYLERNPIAAWTEGAGTGGEHFFSYEGGIFSSKIVASEIERSTYQELTRELAEWRLAEYLDRPGAAVDGTWLIKVNHAGGTPILMPLNRELNPGLPEGWTPVRMDGQKYFANFVAQAVNVVRRENSERNELSGILRGWFGPDAGAPGTRHQVQVRREEDGWIVAPVGVGILSPVPWRSYSREQIPRLFGMDFVPAVWQQGFVRRGDKTFLLVTLDKSTAATEHKYEDRFISSTEFHWQSQNQTKRDSAAGKSIENHSALGIEIHLFVRSKSKGANSKANPFVYCGPVDFVRWENDGPITVWWRLRDEVPEHLRAELRVPLSD
jgi:superfamily II DNA or RNA helicase/HKD family nuclease/diadenosine tetraphosphate (Ap4A) HIT family hydrolase